MIMMSLAKANGSITFHIIIMITMEEIFTLENLNDAFYKSSKASHWKESVHRYRSNLLINNVKLQDELLSGNYTVSPTTNFIINERGKIRNISAPSIRDRIVQKILCQKVLNPILIKTFIYDNYASLPNRGTSFARKRIQIMLHNYIKLYGTEGYILQIDIKKYFDSINHSILKSMLQHQLDKYNIDDNIVKLIYYLIDTSSNCEVGLNLGAEMPQILALYYLSRIDTFVKTVQRVKFYGRYMDDMFIIHPDKECLKSLLNMITIELNKLNLSVNDKKTHIVKLSHGFTFMQIKYHIDANTQKVIKRPTHNKIVRERHRIKKYYKKYLSGDMTLENIQNCYMSWRNSLIKDCNCLTSIKHMDYLFNRLFNKSNIIKQGKTPLIQKEDENTWILSNLTTEVHTS